MLRVPTLGALIALNHSRDPESDETDHRGPGKDANPSLALSDRKEQREADNLADQETDSLKDLAIHDETCTRDEERQD